MLLQEEAAGFQLGQLSTVTDLTLELKAASRDFQHIA